MAESDDSEFNSVTSSQRSFLKTCPFADPNSIPTKSSEGEVVETTNSIHTEILNNPDSPPVIKTPVISLSSPTSLDSINNDVFRTPPENPSLSSTPNPQNRVRVLELTPNLNSPSPKPDWTPVRVLETNRRSDSVRVLFENPSLSSAPNPQNRVRVSELTSNLNSPSPEPDSTPVRVLETNRRSDTVRVLFENPSLSSAPSPQNRARVLQLTPGLNSPSPKPVSASPVGVLETNRPSGYVGNSGVSSSSVSTISNSESVSLGGDKNIIPKKDVIRAIFVNSGGRRDDEQDSYVNMLKQCGLKFP